MGMPNESNPTGAVSVAVASAVLVWGLLYFVNKAYPAEAPAAPKYTIELDQNDLNSLSVAINELPKRVADPLIAKINAQLQEQMAAGAGNQQQPRAHVPTAPPMPPMPPTPEPKKD